MKVSVIVPVYNEAATVGEVLARLQRLPLDLEVIAVDDGSRDGSGEALEALRKDRPCLKQVLRLPENRGKGGAVRAGLAAATGDVVVIQDADLELDPGQILDLVGPIAKGEAEVVYGTRFPRGNAAGTGPEGCEEPGEGSWANRAGNRFLTALTNLLFGLNLTDMETCYKSFRACWIPKLRLTAERFEFEPEITAEFARLGLAIREVPIRYRPRTRREGKKIRWWDGLRAVRMLLRKRWEGMRTGAEVRPPGRG